MYSREAGQKPPEFTFDASPNVVAQQIRGAIIIVSDKRFVIMEADGFPGEEITRKEFQAAKKEPIGTISGSPYRGKLTFPNITIQDEGLVMPRAINELMPDGATRYVFGPDKVARTLGIEQNGRYQLAIDDPYSKVLRIKEFPQETT